MEFLDIQKEENLHSYREQVWTLYEQAFPPEEKKPRELMEKLQAEGKMELLAITEQGEFLGLAMNMLSGKGALLDYFAISEKKRSGGYGSRAVRMLQERFQGKTYIFEIEMQDPKAENAEDRKRRKAFYLRNGLKETQVLANVYHTDFELLTPDGMLSFEQYMEVLLDVLGEEGVEIIHPYPILTEG